MSYCERIKSLKAKHHKELIIETKNILENEIMHKIKNSNFKAVFITFAPSYDKKTVFNTLFFSKHGNYKLLNAFDENMPDYSPEDHGRPSHMKKYYSIEEMELLDHILLVSFEELINEIIDGMHFHEDDYIEITQDEVNFYLKKPISSF